MRRLRILVTGCTQQHCGKPHQVGYVLTPQLVVQTLRAAGHEVDWRPVVPGEPLQRNYNTAVVFIWGPEARNANHFYGAMYALLELPNALMMMDDWRIGPTFTTIRRMVRAPSNLLRAEANCRRFNVAEGKPYFDKILKKLDDIGAGRGHRLALSLFPWGNRRLLPIPNFDLLREFDPSPLVLPLYRDLILRPDKQRESRWLFPTLGDHTQWLEAQRLTWPVESYGGPRRLHLPRIDERDVVRRYGEVEAMLAFRTPISGSGWYRPRFAQAAAMHCPLAGDPIETMPIGAPYRYRPAEIELLSLKNRRELAHEQAALFARRIWTKRQLIERLDTLVYEQSTKKRRAA